MELVVTFNNTLNNFIGSMKRCYPNETTDLKTIEMMQDTRPLQRFMKEMNTHMDKITNKDETIFDSKFECIENCDLTEIWKRSENDVNRNAIWKYLQTLSLIGTTIRSKSANLEQFFDQFTEAAENSQTFTNNPDIQEQMMNMFKNLLDGSDLDDENEGEDENEDAEETDAPEKEQGADAYTDMFKGTKIGGLAKEIAEDIDMSAFEDIQNMDSPDISTIMGKLVGGGGIKKLIQSVADKLKNKMASGDVNQEDLVGEVHEMMEKMKKDKKFKKMFKKKDVQSIFKEFMNQKGADAMGGDVDDDDFSALEEMMGNVDMKKTINQGMPSAPIGLRGGMRKNAARNRLRRKLEAKKNDEQKTDA